MLAKADQISLTDMICVEKKITYTIKFDKKRQHARPSDSVNMVS